MFSHLQSVDAIEKVYDFHLFYGVAKVHLNYGVHPQCDCSCFSTACEHGKLTRVSIVF